MTSSLLTYVVIAGLPDGEAIRRKAAEVLARRDFQLDADRDDQSLSILARLGIWLLKMMAWFAKLLDGLPSPLWWLVVIGLVVTLIALCAHIVWTFIVAIKGGSKRRTHLLTSDDRRVPEEFERAADQAERDGDYIGAIRLRFRAGILRIELAENRPLRRGITNHELLRRYRSSPFFEPLQWFVQTIDSKWYGHGECQPDDCFTCRSEYDRICQLANRRAHAVGA